MISLCNYCDRHTSADGLKWILNDLTKVEYQETSGKAMIVEAMDPYGPPLPPIEPAMSLLGTFGSVILTEQSAWGSKEHALQARHPSFSTQSHFRTWPARAGRYYSYLRRLAVW